MAVDSTLSSSHSSDLSNADTNDTNLLEIIQNTKKYYLNPILQHQQQQQQRQIKNEDYSYYQREYEEINETLLFKKCSNCSSIYNNNNNYSSSSSSSTSSTSQLLSSSSNKNFCLTCERNLVKFMTPQQHHQRIEILNKSSFKPIKSINEIDVVQSPPLSYLYYAC